jgi:hypothetical protein
LKKSLGGCDFLSLDAEGFSVGLIIGWNHNVSLINYFSIHLGLCTEVYNKFLDLIPTLLNLYGPYEGKQIYWDNCFSFECFKVENLTIGGDLNLMLNRRIYRGSVLEWID